MSVMPFEEARRRLEGNRYNLIPINGEPYWMVFWPPDAENRRQTGALTMEEIIDLAMSVPLPGETKGRPTVDIERVGIVGRLIKAPIGCDSDGDPKVQIVIEICGRRQVDSLPMDHIKEMAGQAVLMQLSAVQLRLNWEKEREGGWRS